MKKYILIFIVFLIVSCSNKKEYNGYWYGKIKVEETTIPVLLKFENNYYIDYFSAAENDTVTYRYFGKRIYAHREQLRANYKFHLKRNDDELSFIFPKDNITRTFKKSVETNFIFDYLDDKSLNIQLPAGQGKENIIGTDIRFYKPMYLTYLNDKLVANFYDTTIVVDKEYYKFIYSKRIKNSEREWSLFPVILIADKDIKISDLNLVKTQLKLSELNNLRYVLKAEQYDSIEFISMRMPPLPENEYLKVEQLGFKLPPLPPPRPELDSDFIANHSILFEINGDSILNQDTLLTEIEIKKLIQKKSKLDSNLVILFYLTENSVYQNYISFIGPVFNSFYELRELYLTEKYGNVNNYSEEEVDKARERYPIILRELTEEEFKKTKYNLLHGIS